MHFNRNRSLTLSMIIMAIIIESVSSYQHIYATEVIVFTRVMFYEIETVNASNYQIRRVNEYPGGWGSQTKTINFRGLYPNRDRFELIEFYWEGTGNCAELANGNWQCTGNITYQRDEFRYEFDHEFEDNNFTIAVGAFDQGADLDLTVEYPPTLTYISANHPPDSIQSNNLKWIVPTMSSFATEITFLDPRAHIYLPIASR